MLPVCLLASCLWIDEAEHGERTDQLKIEAAIVSVLPDVWSDCGATSAPFTVTFEVAEFHSGETFDVSVEVIGGERLTLPPTTADGTMLEVSFDLATDAFGCTGRCAVATSIGLERLGVSEEHRVDLLVVNDGLPEVDSVFVKAPDEEIASLDELVLSASPPSSVSVEDWPTFSYAISDGYAAIDEGGDLLVAACPPGADPATDASACTLLTTMVDDDNWAHVVASAETAPLGPLGCEAALAGESIHLFALVEDHACGEALSYPLTAGVPLFVQSDCDQDGVESPFDCDDLDPTRAPGLTETWYDGIDSDCSGGSDLDQDGDGEDALGYGGDDCDDEDAARLPGALEICDGRDNDCDALLAFDQATLTSAIGVVNYPSVQAALDAAVEGDTVAVCDGDYFGPFVIDEAVDFVSGSLDPSRTTLVAGAPGESVVRVGNEGDDLDVTIAGFTITGADGVSDGGGIDARGASVLELADLVVADNDAARGGGLALAGQVAHTRVEVRDNTAIDGGGIVATSGAVLTFEDTVIGGNAATVSGGGVFVVGSLTLAGTGVIEANHAEASGGGLYGEGAGAVLTITGAVFSGNESEDTGGGIFAQSTGATPIAIALDDTRLEANDATSGGAMVVMFATLETGEVTIEANTAAWGGGIHASDASVVDLGALGGVASLTGNVADIAGGGVYVADGASLLRGVDAVFDRNVSDDGGAIDTAGGDVDLTGGALTANEASEDGGAIRVGGGATAYLRGAIAADGNVASGAEQVVYVSAGLLVVCGGTNVTDPVANTSGSYTFVDCYEVDGVNGVANECDGC